MTAEPMLTFVEASGQVVQQYLPTGAAGGAWLHPAQDIELIFDRAAGSLCTLSVSAGTAGGTWELSDPAATFLTTHFGNSAAQLVGRVAGRRRAAGRLKTQIEAGSALSALARLRTARATSPVPASPWWDAQEAQLALEAGLEPVARAAAVRAVRALATIELPAVTERQAAAAQTAADLARAEDAAAASAVRAAVAAAAVQNLDDYLASRPATGEPGRSAGRGSGGPGRLRSGWRPQGAPVPGLDWALDLTIVPPGMFLPALSARDDLLVAPGAKPGTATVSLRLAPGADPKVLGRCRARLVAPAERRVLSQGSFGRRGSLAVAELAVPRSASEQPGAWIEVVDGERRPVRSVTLRLFKRALRGADAALRAGQEPRGLAPDLTSTQWQALAAAQWRDSGADWLQAGDDIRARLAGQPALVSKPSIAEEVGW